MNQLKLDPPWSWSTGRRIETDVLSSVEPTESRVQEIFRNLETCATYLSKHRTSSELFDDREPIPGEFEGRFEPKDGRSFAVMILDRKFDSLDEMSDEAVATTLAAATPPLPNDPTIAAWAAEISRVGMVEDSFEALIRYLVRRINDVQADVAQLIRRNFIYLTDRYRLELPQHLAEKLLDAIASLLPNQEADAYFETVAADPLSPQWMVWRAQGIWHFDDDKNLIYGPDPHSD